MKVYPNPTRSTAFIAIPKELQAGGNMTISNSNGEVILTRPFSKNQADILPFDLTGEPNGMYKVTVQNDIFESSYEILNLSQLNYPVVI